MHTYNPYKYISISDKLSETEWLSDINNGSLITLTKLALQKSIKKGQFLLHAFNYSKFVFIFLSNKLIFSICFSV